MLPQLFTALSILFVGFIGCFNMPNATASTNYGPDNTSININHGKAFTVEIPSNPSTGYQLNLVRPLSPLLELVKEFFVSDCPNTRKVGCGGKQFYIFKALTAGKTSLEFTYARSWEPESGTKYIFNVVVFN